MDTITTLPNLPQRCGCASCQAVARDGVTSSDYTGSASATTAEANTLYSGYRWGTGTTGTSLTYKFYTALPDFYAPTDSEAKNFSTLNDQMKSAVGRVLDQISSFTNITFAEATTGNGNIGFGQASLGAGTGAWAYYPHTHPKGGDVWVNNDYASTQSPAEGNYGFYVLLHEIGHSIGLQHSFTAGLTGDENTSRYTVMAYNWAPFYSSSYMVYDIAALQKIYGANMTYNTGDTVYTANATKGYTLWDAGGVDTLDASAQTNAVTLDLREGEYSSVGLTRNIGIAFGAVIENATGGSGNDILIGNAGNNTLNGGAGNDTFIGGKGTDTLIGGEGTDLAVFDNILANYTLSRIDGNTLRLVDTSSQYGTTTITGVETLVMGNVNHSVADLIASLTPPAPPTPPTQPDTNTSNTTPSTTTTTTTTTETTTTTTDTTGTTTTTETTPPTPPAPEVIDPVTFGFSTLVQVSKKRFQAVTTDIISSEEGVFTYKGTDFKQTSTADFLTLTRDHTDTYDSLSVSVLSAGKSVLKTLAVNDTQNLSDLSLTGVDTLTVKDITAAQDLHLAVTGSTTATVSTGTGNDALEVTNTTTTTIATGSGDDTVDLTGVTTGTVDTGAGNDTIDVTTSVSGRSSVYYMLKGGEGDDTITLTATSTGRITSTLYGGAGDDVLSVSMTQSTRLYGEVGNDTLNGGDAADVLDGGADNDTIHGGAGNDTLYGGIGDDILFGGYGSDSLFGGLGADVFAFDTISRTAYDVVGDFNAKDDIIDLSALIEGYDPVSDAISDFVRISASKKTTLLLVDTDGAENGQNFIAVANIAGIRGQNLDDLEHNGHLIL